MIYVGRELHPREQQVLAGMAAGLTNVEIGARLHLGANTIKTYQQRLFRTLGARSRAHAVSLGFLFGLLPDPQFPVTSRPSDEDRAAVREVA